MNKAEKTVLLVVKSLLSRTGFLLVLAAAIFGTSIFASVYTGQWHWFQRSGALVTSIGAILSTRRLLRIGLDGLLEGGSYFDVATNPGASPGDKRDMESGRDLTAAYWGFMIVGLGTVVWAFGDLIGCLIAQNMDCVA
ncbi:MAG: hypothetical protein ABFS24_14505 [Pseudomonadota bacterium]